MPWRDPIGKMRLSGRSPYWLGHRLELPPRDRESENEGHEPEHGEEVRIAAIETHQAGDPDSGKDAEEEASEAVAEYGTRLHTMDALQEGWQELGV